jgi:phenylpropionate dioxygenase-like ring-hydroxylating dioxygenase large terminal subunit
MAATEAQVLAERLKVARRMADHIRDGSSDLAPAAMVNLASTYTDPERHRREREVLFARTPQLVCLSSELKEPGAYLTFDEAGPPVLVTRGKDGAVRAFLNICTHRGARLVREDGGKASRFTCWFHGWTFANDGRLLAAPEGERFGEATLADCGHLHALACEERHGMVFVMPTPGVALDLDAHLEGFGGVLEGLNLDRCERVKAGVIPVAANWKYALDTYGECYHFAALHKVTLAPYFRNDVTVHDRWGRHQRVSFAQREWDKWPTTPESDWGLDPVPAGIHLMYPNVVLFAGSVSPGKSYLTIFRHFPGEAVGETRTHKTIYALGGVRDDAHRKEVEDAFDATAHVIITEDYVTAAEGWRNLTALPQGATVVYGRQELALQQMHRNFADALGEPICPQPTAHLQAAE